jgi:hypothetical protein
MISGLYQPVRATFQRLHKPILNASRVIASRRSPCRTAIGRQPFPHKAYTGGGAAASCFASYPLTLWIRDDASGYWLRRSGRAWLLQLVAEESRCFSSPFALPRASFNKVSVGRLHAMIEACMNAIVVSGWYLYWYIALCERITSRFGVHCICMALLRQGCC